MSAFVSAIHLVSQYRCKFLVEFLYCCGLRGIRIVVGKGAGSFLQNQAYCDAF
jgi:hypothetical protein